MSEQINENVNELVKKAIQTKDLKNPKYSLSFGNISDKLYEIYEKINDSDMYFTKYNIPFIKYDNFYFNLSDLYIDKILLDTNTFQEENFSYYLFKDGKINENILNKREIFSTFTVGLSKEIGSIKLYYNNLDFSKFEIVDNSDLNYEEQIENTLNYITFNKYKFYLETKDELNIKVPVGESPKFNELSLSFIDKMNLFYNNKLFDEQNLDLQKGEYVNIENISNKILIYIMQLYKPNDFYHTDFYRILQYKNN